VYEIKKTSYIDIKCVTLGSRKNLCVNEKVNQLRNIVQINDKCLDMQGSKSIACEYLSKNDDRIQKFSDQVHVSSAYIEHYSGH
jgi:chromosome transmission fidelity protein 1